MMPHLRGRLGERLLRARVVMATVLHRDIKPTNINFGKSDCSRHAG